MAVDSRAGLLITLLISLLLAKGAGLNWGAGGLWGELFPLLFSPTGLGAPIFLSSVLHMSFLFPMTRLIVPMDEEEIQGSNLTPTQSWRI